MGRAFEYKDCVCERKKERKKEKEKQIREIVKGDVEMYLVVDGDPVGPANSSRDHRDLIRTVQTCPANARVLAPLCPEQVPENPKQDNIRRNSAPQTKSLPDFLR